ncbi:MAG: type 1 glutamine amidotransferase-like domain-containing protein [Candidatus Diapherotrites archaeon]|uniref:Type 1 glutamine amidotransferase-like domain-containing protein n=1 Tax=Candidatus Iainarchaeum sp. TaxID=3101447 RepID=A0A7K4BYU9_9ARCH|nr:type 1 glutamine amidotransferase-like domain-containing protein [Candidatus Diapherotrites archaeon]
MKFYLSSLKIGDKPKDLLKLVGKNKKAAYISNALDYTTDLDRRRFMENKDMGELRNTGFEVEKIELRQFFYKEKELEEKLKNFGLIWVRGGNEFVLRQAMRLSGLENILKKFQKEKTNIVYGGYGAGITIIGPTLKGIELIEDIEQKPYPVLRYTIWEGIGLIDYQIVPHHDKENPGVSGMNELIEYYEENEIKYKTLKDGEVIIIK